MCDSSHKGQRLPASLAVRLPADSREALQHAVRRQILRALDRDAQMLSASEVVKSGLAPCSVPCASYHLRALEKSGLVEQVASEPVGGSMKHYFSSSIGDRDLVPEVLRDTERSDKQLLANTAS